MVSRRETLFGIAGAVGCGAALLSFPQKRECVIVPAEFDGMEFTLPGDPRVYKVSADTLPLLRKRDAITLEVVQLGDNHETRVFNYARFRDWWRTL